MSGSRRRPGRLGPFVDGYRARLLERGYSPGSVLRSLATLGHLDRWMDRHDTPVDELNGDAVQAFLEDHVNQYGHLPTASVMPLLDRLQAEGVISYEPMKLSSPLHGFVDEYRNWLAVERALSPDTVRGYTRLASRFLEERVSAENELWVEGLTGADVTAFLLHESARVRPGSLCCHANQLRQLLRFLGLRGFADPGLADAVPSVGRWRDDQLPTTPLKRQSPRAPLSAQHSSRRNIGKEGKGCAAHEADRRRAQGLDARVRRRSGSPAVPVPGRRTADPRCDRTSTRQTRPYRRARLPDGAVQAGHDARPSAHRRDGAANAGIDTSTIALWLGHEQERTTHVYLHADLELKQRTLDRITPPSGHPGRYRAPDSIIAFLDAL